MRLVRLKLSNFRCYENEFTIDIDDLTVFIGRNDFGKSTLFDALDIFFAEKGVPDGDDLCVHGDGSDIRVTCVFDDLPAELVIDAQRSTDLRSEYLLNRDGHLEITKAYTCTSTGKGKPAGIFSHANHPSAQEYEDLLTLTNAKLKQRAKTLGVDLTDVNESVNTELRRAIWAHCPDLQCQEGDVELKTEAAGKIWDQLKKHLPIFALFKSDRPSTDQDAEAQDPMKAAVKEAIRGQEATLDSIAAQVTQQIQQIADETVEKIREMSPELASQLNPRVTTKNWDTLFSVSLTGDEEIPINKRGSGTRRLVLLNFFRAKAERDAETRSTGVIYAVEEPETSQHPHNQTMLIDAFEDLAERDGCQVLLTTHNPLLARRFDQKTLRYIARQNKRPVVHYGQDEHTLREIRTSLGVLPDHNIKVFFGVEGRNDINFLRSISRTLHESGEDIPDLGQAEDDGHLVFVPLGGSSMDLWISRLEGFGRPEFYLLDRDTTPPEEASYKAQADAFNKQANSTAWITNKRELENYIHQSVILGEYPGYSGAGDPFEDVPTLFAQAVHEASGSDKTWGEVLADPDKTRKKVSTAKKRLNKDFVAKMTPDLLTEVDTDDDVRSWLKAVGEALRT